MRAAPKADHRTIRFLASFHARSVEEVYRELATGPGGLSDEEAAHRLERFKANRLEAIGRESLLLKFLANFTHLLALLLWVAGLVAFVARMPQLGAALWMLNVINGLFGFWQEYKAERVFEALGRLLPLEATVIRNGVQTRIPADQLVPGDLLVLAEGDHISADARVVESGELRVDQSALTGESRPVRKTPAAQPDSQISLGEFTNIVFAGANVAAGSGQAVVFATGMNTEFGKIAHLTQTVREELSPLERELKHVTRVITLVAAGAGGAFFLAAFLLGTLSPADSFLFALGMIVAFVPEGLLPALTLSLAIGGQRMAKRNALIKRLSAVDTLGCITVICTDKTGTLTGNEMTVRALWTLDGSYRVQGTGYSPEGRVEFKGEQPESLHLMLRAAALCNHASIVRENDRWQLHGDPTEGALVAAAMKAGIDVNEERRSDPKVGELGFDSHRKRMSTVHDGGRTVYVKGAPRELLALCSRVRVQGVEIPIEADERGRILAACDKLAREGWRVLGVAQRTLAEPPPVLSGEIEQDLTFLGLAAMEDPPRPGVTRAIAMCHRAGIRNIMITGDDPVTAHALALEIGMAQDPVVLHGSDVDALPDKVLRQVCGGELIIARATPEHKLRMVRTFQEMGHIVAVTGDGVSDAPALKKANIGVAMGGRGTDVARESADIVLLDDNFATLVDAIEEGRGVYANLKKLITYIVTSNTPEASPFVLYAFSGGRIPLALNIMRILSVDLGTDMAPALALGAERPEERAMSLPPRKMDEHLFSWGLLGRAYLVLGIPQSVLVMAAFYLTFWWNGYRGQWLDLPSSGPVYVQACSMALAAVVATQIGNVFGQRTERASVLRISFFGNRRIWWGIAFQIAVLLLILYVPVLRRVFGTGPLPLVCYGVLLAMAPALLLIDEAGKAWLRRRQRRNWYRARS
ncbi:MAG: cation-transporting P-type ATPase [Acidobacteria bacterium]|nr:cation-transporting P-type ATPase [Acidobacteriota bacterium]